MHTTHFISNLNIQTAYHDKGEGHPFVLVHGFTGSKLDFQDQLGWFSNLRRVIAYDQRGHGESSNTGPYTFQQLVDDLMNFLDRLQIDTCDLLGHSLGGMVAMRAVLAHPERFSSLILMDTSPTPIEIFPQGVHDQLIELVEREGCEALVGMMRGQPASPAQQLGVDYLGELEHWRRISAKLSQMDPQAFTELAQQLAAADSLLTQLAELNCPTTVVVGAKDDPFIEASSKMGDLIPGASVVTIAQAGHSPQYENAEAWREAITAHLTNRSRVRLSGE